MTEFPHNEYDPTCHPYSNAQHMKFLLQGYRAAVLKETYCPYSPGGARGVSWTIGFNQATRDLK